MTRFNTMRPLSRILSAAALGCLGAGSAQTVFAGDLFVCAHTCTYPTIQGAIDNSQSGDIIHIAAGTYFENLVTRDKSVTLLGEGEDLTVIDGRYLRPVLTLGQLDSSFPTIRVIGVTITHGSGSTGGGIFVLAARLDLENSIVTSNRASQDGGGIGFQAAVVGTSQIIKSMITHNRAASLGGGIHAGVESLVRISNSTIARNTAGLRGGGLHVDANNFVTVQGSTLADNTAQNGGAVFVESGLPSGAVTLSGSSVVGNTAMQDGGGLSGGRQELQSTVIARNRAGQNGGGIEGVRRVSLTDVFVVENTAAGLGGGVFGGSGPLTGITIVDNHPTDCVLDDGTACP